MTDEGTRAGVRRPGKAREVASFRGACICILFLIFQHARLSRGLANGVATYFKCAAVDTHGVAGGDFTLVVVACCPPACSPRLAASMASSSTCLE